jgi:hypothetical protein
LFKWRHFEPAIITCAVGWYLRFSLSYRDVEELLTERGIPAAHTNHLALGPVLRAGIEQALPPGTEAHQRILEGG